MYPFDSQSNNKLTTSGITHIYFVALIPPPELQVRINELKQIFAADFQSSHALKSPPHITVIPPIRLQDLELFQLIRFFENHKIFMESAQITLNGFGCFKPRVIYIQPEIPAAFLEARCALAYSFYTAFPGIKPDTKPYHPHLTLAFKDLSPSMFTKAWARFSTAEFHDSFKADRLFLLRYESGSWEIFKEFPFEV